MRGFIIEKTMLYLPFTTAAMVIFKIIHHDMDAIFAGQYPALQVKTSDTLSLKVRNLRPSLLPWLEFIVDRSFKIIGGCRIYNINVII